MTTGTAAREAREVGMSEYKSGVCGKLKAAQKGAVNTSPSLTTHLIGADEMANRKYITLPPLTPKQITRFWSKVAIKSPNECWLWTAVKTGPNKDYGRFLLRTKHPVFAHRVAYLAHYGVDPAGMDVCHACDNPLCCNPLHLFLGTHEDNMQDKIRKNRHAHGDKHSITQSLRVARQTGKEPHPITSDDVRAIRARYAAGGVTQLAIAVECGINKQTINDIIHRRTWKHVD